MGMLLNIVQKHNKTTSEGLFNYSALLLVAKVGLSPGNIAVLFSQIRTFSLYLRCVQMGTRDI